ncbi:MAG: hypothetical protein GTO02_04250 [Candidatus Dadabacteria bacterium]|nr:hypothetical protein [Candidatus Dadabacteria bacterium]NIQ13633.1 hypothetical protein [Candidatus Dadabacteria bacterium]
MYNQKKLVIITIFILILIPSLVFGYHVLNIQNGFASYAFRTWSSVPQDFRVDSGTLGGDDGLPIVNNACQTWNNVEGAKNLCGNLTRSSSDITSANFASIADDDINDVVFDDDGMIFETFFGAGAGSGILGIGCTTALISTGEILEATLIINGTIPSTTSADQLATTVHEFGHIWGLAHTPIGGINTDSSFPVGLDPIDPSDIPTMFPFAIPVTDVFGRTLEIDDEAIIKLQYPE